ncbi:ankyrin repeat domain-containing protein [Pseudomonas sp. NFXW11]|uniref:ankyrin repeat domain-containing protein n=1 Tax=Pseudomonas sp. NFXW11 TaxID=2819531 RepID=UPI003CEE095D
MSHLLEKAAARGDLAALERLLDAGANLEWQHKGTGRSALLAATIAGHPAAVSLLLERGANIHQRCTALGYNALTWAAYNGDLTMARLLLEHGAELDPASPELQRTALMTAAQAGHGPMVSLLLAAGADPHRLDFQQRNAWSLAEEKAHAAVMQLLQQAGSQAPPASVEPAVLPWPEPLADEASDADPVAQVRAYTLALAAWEQRGNSLGHEALDAGFWAEPQQLIERFCTQRPRAYARASYGYPSTYSPADELLACAQLKPAQAEVLIRDPAARALCYEHRFLLKRIAGQWRIDSVKRRLAGTQKWANAIL